MFSCSNSTRKVDNSCSGGSGGEGPPGPPGPPGPDCDLATMEFCENYSQMLPGDTSFNLINIKVTTPNPANLPMIFNSSVPSAGDTQLGTPNIFYAGPGIGAGGGPGPGMNSLSLGNVMIISDDNDPLNPKSSPTGGTLIYTFTNEVNTKSIQLINAEGSIDLYNIDNILIANVPIQVLGLNSYQNLALPYKLVKRMEINLTNSAAVGEFCYTRAVAAGTTLGYIQVIDNGVAATSVPNTPPGSYQLVAESVISDGAVVVFFAAKAETSMGGSLVRLVNSNSITDETLQIRWNANQPIKLYHNIPRTGATGAYITYKYALTTIL
jgi:hypothetical protein